MFSRRGFIKSSAVLGIGSGLVSDTDAALSKDTEDKKYASSSIQILDNGLISFEVLAIYFFYDNLERTLERFRCANIPVCYPVIIGNQIFGYDKVYLNVSSGYPILYNLLDFNKKQDLLLNFESHFYHCVKNDLKLIVTGKPNPGHSVDVRQETGGTITISKNYDKKDYM